MMCGVLADFSVEQHGGIGLDTENILSQASYNLHHKKHKQFFLCGHCSLQWIISILAAYLAINLLSPREKYKGRLKFQISFVHTP
ncbi:hypothetical protein [Neisseria musculi]|uniref:hypothetical protein n=1 Tax=Neisseria musculi TaxID=1815583 RepID=UPI0036095C47